MAADVAAKGAGPSDADRALLRDSIRGFLARYWSALAPDAVSLENKTIEGLFVPVVLLTYWYSELYVSGSTGGWSGTRQPLKPKP